MSVLSIVFRKNISEFFMRRKNGRFCNLFAPGVVLFSKGTFCGKAVIMSFCVAIMTVITALWSLCSCAVIPPENKSVNDYTCVGSMIRCDPFSPLPS